MKQDRSPGTGPELVIDQQRRESGEVPGAGEGFRFPPLLATLGHRALDNLNSFGRLLLKDGRPFISLDPDYLVEKSCRLTGLTDFGEPDFSTPFRILMRSFVEDARLNLLGRITVATEMLRVLSNRLRMTRDLNQFPGIAAERIVRPMFITGLPRSGTTFLHALLAQDPACRAPQVWEAMHPSPPPETASYLVDPRIARTRKELAWIDVLMPDFDKCHTIEARLPQECIAITDHSFLSYVFESMYFVTSYRRWHDRQDKTPAYRCHRNFLKHLQWHCPGSHWVLKAPSHLMALDALFRVYPDAQVVVTHRDPLKVLPSCASFARVLRAPFTGPIDLKELGGEVSRRWVDSANLLTELRGTRDDLAGNFCDVGYPELIRDPLAVVRRIYRHFGRDLRPEAEAAMQRFVVEHPKDKRGAHLYSLEQFGLDADLEREKFRHYTESYDVAVER
ncbi:putative sulfotransferase [Geomonas limicola]|uniref:Putative sulfotransferase n=1 Tax=Geomonas limicola TaxID=2740186 RepID=A0A6V8NFI0_9BACT|nr:sulfotransferase [Geomonas limicola]GFO69809.1 putative sulfotransferase [Geomonas limicola]